MLNELAGARQSTYRHAYDDRGNFQLKADIPQPPKPDKRPQHWDLFLYHYGNTVYVAHSVEKQLASLLWFLDARKRNVLRQPTAGELLEMIVAIDGNTFGELLNQIAEYQIDHDAMRLFKAANANRNILVHQFTTKFAAETADGQDFRAAAERVRALAEPILAAHEIVEKLLTEQISWMQAQILADAMSTPNQVAESPDEKCDLTDELLGSSPYVIADKAHCLFEPEHGSAVRVIPPYGSKVDVVRDEGQWVQIRFSGKQAWSPRGNLSARLIPRRPAVAVGIVPPPNYAFRSLEQSSELPVETGPRGGRYVRTDSGFKRYL